MLTLLLTISQVILIMPGNLIQAHCDSDVGSAPSAFARPSTRPRPRDTPRMPAVALLAARAAAAPAARVTDAVAAALPLTMALPALSGDGADLAGPVPPCGCPCGVHAPPVAVAAGAVAATVRAASGCAT